MALYVIDVAHTAEECFRAAKEFETHPRGPDAEGAHVAGS
jgi:hypothetical protein